MEISNFINIVLCILSFLLAVISIITVVITLRQNNKMIENSTRPYVVIYNRTTNFQSPSYYLIIKNMGQSGAEVKDFSCSVDLSKVSFSEENIPFKHIIGTFVAPGQSIMSNIDPRKLHIENISNIIFNIKYVSSGKEYIEEYKVNVLSDKDNIQTRASTKDKELKIISYTLQDLVEKML